MKATPMDSPRIVLCEHCGSEGRIYANDTKPWADEPSERDDGPCPACEGTGGEIIETEPVMMEELDDICGDIMCPRCHLNPKDYALLGRDNEGHVCGGCWTADRYDDASYPD